MDSDNNQYLIETCEALNDYKRERDPEKKREKLQRFSALLDAGRERNLLDIGDLMIIFNELNNDAIDAIRKLTKGIYV